MKTNSTRRPAISRRQWLAAAGSATAAIALSSGRASAADQPWPLGRPQRFARPRPDLLDAESAAGIEVVQLTAEADVPSAHLYMEAQVFTPDSKRLILHRAASAHGGNRGDPRHQYLLCDLDDGCALRPLTDEPRATAASVSPDGQTLYYFVDETRPGAGTLTLKRVGLDGARRETLLVVDRPISGGGRPSRCYPLSTISSDGQRLALSAFFGDGQTPNAPAGLMVFDLQQATVAVVIAGPTWCNMHPQYSRSLDPQQSHDILIQENHGCVLTKEGTIEKLVGGEGADIHVVRDDGTNFRNMPWGRDGNEFCQGHQCWRGRSDWAITSTGTRKPPEAQLIEGRAGAHAGHVGIATPAAARNDLSRGFPQPKFYHFGVDIEGRRLISDAPKAKIYLAQLDEPGRGPARAFTYLLNCRSSQTKQAHVHPFLSPDGKLAFFNSDESGVLQAYMIRLG